MHPVCVWSLPQLVSHPSPCLVTIHGYSELQVRQGVSGVVGAVYRRHSSFLAGKARNTQVTTNYL